MGQRDKAVIKAVIPTLFAHNNTHIPWGAKK